MNGDYLGCYFLCEHVRVGRARVNIDELTAEAVEKPEIQGGYLLAMNAGWGTPQENVLETARNETFEIVSPNLSPANGGYESKAQRDYILDYVQRAEDAIFAADGSWTAYLDEQSLIDFWWIQEFSVNKDGFATPSNFLYKPRTEADGRRGQAALRPPVGPG